ncbi:MAG: ABC transporter permease [Bradymonadia bacterium]
MGMLIRVAWRNLIQGGRRTLLLSVALMILTSLALLLGGLTRGVEQTLVRAASTLMSGHVNVGGFYRLSGGGALPLVTGVGGIRELVKAEVPEATYVIDRLRGFGRLISADGGFFVGVNGVDVGEERGLMEVLELATDADGKPMGRLEDLVQPSAAVLFAGQAERLKVKVGDGVTLSSPTLKGVNNTVDLTVVAICRDLGALSNLNIFTAKPAVRTLYQIKDDTTGAIQIYLDDPEQATAVMGRLREALKAKGHDMLDYSPQPFFTKFGTVSGMDFSGQRLDLSIWRDEIVFLLWIVTGLETLRVLILSVLAAIVIVGILNTMLMAIRERTREVGTLRAIGMGRGRVLTMFMLEACMLGALASGAGALLAWAVGSAVNSAGVHIPMEAFQVVLMSDRLFFAVGPGDVLSTILGVTTITALAALLPARRAARMRPITAIHHIG